MIAQRYHLRIERTDFKRNMARFYQLSIESTLFGDVSLTRNWGRIGRLGQQRVHLFNSEKEAAVLFRDRLLRSVPAAIDRTLEPETDPVPALRAAPLRGKDGSRRLPFGLQMVQVADSALRVAGGGKDRPRVA